MVDAVNLTTDLDPRVGSGKPRELELKLEFKVLELSGSPNEPSVLAEGLSFGDFPDDGILLDPPMVPIPFPSLESPIKDSARLLCIELGYR
jgi:hypothetical protein